MALPPFKGGRPCHPDAWQVKAWPSAFSPDSRKATQGDPGRPDLAVNRPRSQPHQTYGSAHAPTCPPAPLTPGPPPSHPHTSALGLPPAPRPRRVRGVETPARGVPPPLPRATRRRGAGRGAAGAGVGGLLGAASAAMASAAASAARAARLELQGGGGKRFWGETVLVGGVGEVGGRGSANTRGPRPPRPRPPRPLDPKPSPHRHRAQAATPSIRAAVGMAASRATAAGPARGAGPGTRAGPTGALPARGVAPVKPSKYLKRGREGVLKGRAGSVWSRVLPCVAPSSPTCTPPLPRAHHGRKPRPAGKSDTPPVSMSMRGH